MKVMAGIDLHSNNAMCGLMDMQGKRLAHRKVGCKLKEVLEVFAPYQKQIDTVAVESTYNWYWLVDGLMDQGYKVALANPAQIDQYDGLKHTDDTANKAKKCCEDNANKGIWFPGINDCHNPLDDCLIDAGVDPGDIPPHPRFGGVKGNI